MADPRWPPFGNRDVVTTSFHVIVFRCGSQKGNIFGLKPAIHLAILYADRRDRRKSPGVPGAAIAIFSMSDIGD